MIFFIQLAGNSSQIFISEVFPTNAPLLDLRRPSDRRRARRVSRRARCAASAEITPCVYDERPRLPVGLAVGAADQAPRACDSAHGLTGKDDARQQLHRGARLGGRRSRGTFDRVGTCCLGSAGFGECRRAGEPGDAAGLAAIALIDRYLALKSELLRAADRRPPYRSGTKKRRALCTG